MAVGFPKTVAVPAHFQHDLQHWEIASQCAAILFNTKENLGPAKYFTYVYQIPYISLLKDKLSADSQLGINGQKKLIDNLPISLQNIITIALFSSSVSGMETKYGLL